MRQHKDPEPIRGDCACSGSYIVNPTAEDVAAQRERVCGRGLVLIRAQHVLWPRV